MSKKVAEQMQIVREYLAKATKRKYDKAHDAIVEISDLSEKKRTRDAAREALLETVRSEELNLAGSAMAYLTMVPLLSSDDADLVPFLRERLAIYHDSDYAYLEGLLAILGPAAYPEALQFVRDPKRSAGSRSTIVESLADITGIPFDRDLLGLTVPEIREEHYHLDELAAWEANGFTEPQIEIPVDDLAALGIELPDDYCEFLLKHRKGESYNYKGPSWWLLTAAELCEPCNIDGQEYPAVRQLKAYAETFQECTGEEETVDSKGKPYPVERLAAGVTIGSSDSGDTLYLDPADKNALWIYHHDGGDVERVAKTFSAWRKKAKRE